MAVELARAALFGLFTYLASFLQIPLGPVPISAQTLVVLLAAFFLKPGFAFLAMLLHALLRLIFTGAGLFLLPSFGFILAFLLVCPALAYAQERMEKTTKTRFLLLLAASLAFYLLGLPYMAWIVNGVLGMGFSLGKIFTVGMLLFLPGDFLKLVLATVLVDRLDKAGILPKA